jgi:hypothetical protein
LLYTEPGPQGVLKLTDFGFAKRSEDGEKSLVGWEKINFSKNWVDLLKAA